MLMYIPRQFPLVYAMLRVPYIRPGIDIYSTSMYTTNCCGCSQCWDPITCTPIHLVGPHDLECICPSCLRHQDQFDDYQAIEFMTTRHPNYLNLIDQLSDDTIDEILDIATVQADLAHTAETVLELNGYQPPPNSPTNQEMHALNGNINHLDAVIPQIKERYDHTNTKNPFKAAKIFYNNLKNDYQIHQRNNKIADAKNFANDHRLQYLADRNKKEYVSSNGRLFKPQDFESTPNFGRIKLKGPKEKGPEYDPTPDYPRPKLKLPGFDKNKQKPVPPKKQPTIPKNSPAPPPPVIDPKDYPGIQDYKPMTGPQPQPYHPQPGPQQQTDRNHHDVVTDVINFKKRSTSEAGPTNSEMHSYNGNIKPYGPITFAKHNRKLKKILRRKLKRKTKRAFIGPLSFKSTIRKSKRNHAISKDNAERKLALKYAKFLRSPNIPPPRLGSTGNNPTKLIHMYYENTFNMSGPNCGGNAAMTNATECMVFLNPKAAVYAAGTPAASLAGVVICFSTTAGITFSNQTTGGNSTSFFAPWINASAALTEAGATSGELPLTRYLGGHVSLICRCPMSTTAPPYMFGGLLGSNQNTAGGVFDNGQQLNQLTNQQIRGMQTSTEEPGFMISSVYVPGTASALNFSTNAFGSNNGNQQDNVSTPYVAMSGCPTTATVTVISSAWFEIQQTSTNMQFSGWSRGPKLSTEDIFDNLPAIKSVQPRALSLGNRNNAGTSVGMIMAQNRKQETPEEKLEIARKQLASMAQQIKDLRLIIPGDHEEKHFEEDYLTPSSDESPTYKNLSKSTIDLALSLKEKLTPGSVTHKTVRNSLP